MTEKDEYFSINRIHSCILQTSTATGCLAMIWANLQSINKSISFEPVHRYSVWEEINQSKNDLSDFITRLNVNENAKDLKVIATNYINNNDNNNTNERRHIYGTLLNVNSNKTIRDSFSNNCNIKLMDYWKEKGFTFENENITQCTVKINNFHSDSSENTYTYPSEKVWRIYI